MYFTRQANELTDFMIRNKLEDVFRLVETQLTYSYGFKYSFYFRGNLTNSFEVTSDTKELDSLALFEYCLGFMDCYLITNKGETMREVKMSRWLATCLVNCDTSGLNESDLEIYNSIDFDFNIVDWAEESSDINGKCAFSNLWDHCVTIQIKNKGE